MQNTISSLPPKVLETIDEAKEVKSELCVIEGLEHKYQFLFTLMSNGTQSSHYLRCKFCNEVIKQTISE
ncbi:hypothetical protein [Viridibacillus arvi]|uniref:hypothetical protein n=1 Tax=Viridibacillus arvi TaxID=263475 RepID=UPI0034CD9593